MRRGQSTLEYVYMVGIFIVVLIAMGVYMKRGFHGKYRDLGDQIGSQYSPTDTTTITANRTISDTSSTSTSTVGKVYSTGGVSISTESQENNSQGTAEIHVNIKDTTGALTGIGEH